MAVRKAIKTELQLSKLKAGDKPYDVPVAVAPGMVVRVTPTGRKSYRWDRGRGHKPRIITYGTFPGMSLSKATKEHDSVRQRHEDGVDPHQSEDAPRTVSELADKFYQERIIPQRKHPEDVLLTIDKEVKPNIGRLRLRSVTTPAVRGVIRKMVERGAPGRAGKALAQIKQMFRFACASGWMDHNPAAPLSPDDIGVVTSTKQRKLSADEIQTLFLAIGEAPKLSLHVGSGIKLLLLLGLRSGELRQTRWENVDLEAGTLTVPPEIQKSTKKQEQTAKPFVVPLPSQAVEILKQLQKLDKEWVFPGQKEKQPLSRKAFEYGVRRLFDLKSKPLEGVEWFTPHDLRRTLRSGLSSLRIPPHVAERCLNHSLGRIVDTYDQHDYLDERREALQKWADYVDLCVNQSEKVALMSREAV